VNGLVRERREFNADLEEPRRLNAKAAIDHTANEACAGTGQRVSEVIDFIGERAARRIAKAPGFLEAAPCEPDR
jgi:hypothetical protein